MTKQETIFWLKKYIERENTLCQCQRSVKTWKDEIAEHSKPLKKEKKAGVLGCVGTGLLVAIGGAIPCAIVFAIIWLIWMIIDIFKTNLRENPDAVLYSDLIIEKAAGLVIEDTTSYFNRHEILGPMIGILIIGFGISCILGIIAIIASFVGDKSIPEKNKRHQEEYEKSQKLLPQLQMMYDLNIKKQKEAEYQLAQMRKNTIVPGKYLSYASQLLDFLENGRADTIKEAINLLHTEWHRQDELREIQRHNEAIEIQNAQIAAEYARSADAANRAADAAEEAAYWEKKRYIDDFFDNLSK